MAARWRHGMLTCSAAVAINNGLGRVPMMGWSTWCTEGSCSRDSCSEDEIKSVAQALTDSGLQALGWTMVAMDDCWEADVRDAQGRLQANATRFPSGMRNLTGWLHGQGFQAGTYTSLGYNTCHSNAPLPLPGSYGSYEQDAQTIVVDWGFDYLKGDWCNSGALDIGNSTVWMASALNSTGEPNIFSFHGIAGLNWTTASGNYARVYSDHHDVWDAGSEFSGTAAIITLMALANTGSYAGPQPSDLGGGYWYPDYDFLMTGGQGCPDNAPGGHCPGQSDLEYRTEFSFWSLGSSVLLFATDPRNITAVMKQALYNTELIAVNQDGGRGVTMVKNIDCGPASGPAPPQQCSLWRRTNSTGAHFIIVFNPNDNTTQPVNANISFADVPGIPAGASVAVRDLWLHTDLGMYSVGLAVAGIEPHEARVLQLLVASGQGERDDVRLDGDMVAAAAAATVELSAFSFEQLSSPVGSSAPAPRLLAAVDSQGYPAGFFTIFSVDITSGELEEVGVMGSIPDSELSGMLAYSPSRQTVYLAAGESYSVNTSFLGELHVPSNTTRIINTGISVSAMEYDGSSDVLWAVWEPAGTNQHLHFGWVNLTDGREAPLVDLTQGYNIPFATFGVSAFDAVNNAFYFLVGIESTDGQSFAVVEVDVSGGPAATPVVTVGTPCPTNMTIQSLAFDSVYSGLLVTSMSPSVYRAGENVTYSLIPWNLTAGAQAGPTLAEWTVTADEYNVYQASALLACSSGAGGQTAPAAPADPCSATSTAAVFVTVDPFTSPNAMWSFPVPKPGSGGLPVHGKEVGASGALGSIWDLLWVEG